jgi:hypothetical protein
MIASRRSHASAVQELLRANADRNLRDEVCDIPNRMLSRQRFDDGRVLFPNRTDRLQRS